MKTTRILTAALFVVSSLTLVACGSGDDCDAVGDITVCGDFGEVVYVAALASNWEQVAWPGVAQEDGTLLVARDGQLIEIARTGDIRVIADLGGLTSPPSMSSDGTVYVVTGDGSPRIASVDDIGRSVSFSDSVSGDQPGSPVTVGNGVVYAGTISGWERAPTQIMLDAVTLDVLRTQVGSSPAVVVTDGSARYLDGSQDCAQPYSDAVAEDASGQEMWRYTEPSGIRDFAPGPMNEIYLVTGDRQLVRLSSSGQVDWRFDTDCADCNIAAAPTVTNDAIYFPVWEGRGAPSGCEGPDVGLSDVVDPLYALDHSGKELWIYDGFDTKSSHFNPLGLVPGTGNLSPVQVETTRHHPSGRPGVASDGTLYAATDGAVVALDSDGNEVGRALYDEDAGEVTSNSGWMNGWIRPGVRPAPVLGPDGTLFVWDGTTVRAFRTGKQAADIPWAAPFGGFNNDGRSGN